MTKREDAYIGAPWSADRHHVVNVSGYLVARASGIAEAARIAAAVTACDGIPLAELEAGIIRELIDT